MLRDRVIALSWNSRDSIIAREPPWGAGRAPYFRLLVSHLRYAGPLLFAIADRFILFQSKARVQ